MNQNSASLLGASCGKNRQDSGHAWQDPNGKPSSPFPLASFTEANVLPGISGRESTPATAHMISVGYRRPDETDWLVIGMRFLSRVTLLLKNWSVAEALY